MKKQLFSDASFFMLLLLCIALMATGIFNDIMEPDGALYASIAKHIVQSNNWMDLFGSGYDWLDKPHMPFWLTAASIKLFGASSFAYKLPSFLCFLVAIFYTYQLAKNIYSKQVAQVATLVYSTALHIIISNFDGKAEIYLTTFIIAATYHTYKAQKNNWLGHVVAAALFSAFAVMTKGLFALITIGAGFIIYWIKTGQWKTLLQPRWYLLLLFTGIFILPEVYSLYTQFDLHPGKVIFGRTNASGVQFFLWDSQFGRFFNNGPIKGTGDLSFFFHTTLWAFLPWAIIFLFAIIHLFKTRSRNSETTILNGSALITFLLFTFSKFQLPHYIVIVFPHFAMLTANYLVNGVTEKGLKRFNALQTVLFFLLIVLACTIIYFYHFQHYIWFIVVMICITLFTSLYKTNNYITSIIKKNIGFALMLAIFLNCLLYPSLLQYQAGMMAGKWMNDNNIKKPVVMYNWMSYTLDYYYHGETKYTSVTRPSFTQIANDSLLVFCSLKELKDVPKDSFTVSVMKTFPLFPVSRLNGKFINYKTRPAELDSFAISQIIKR